MASPFAKYQSEQVQQIAPGFVEGFAKGGASIGQGIATIGAGVGKYMDDAEKRKIEDAKTQGAVNPYLRNEVENVNRSVENGFLQVGKDGKVSITPGQEQNLDPNKIGRAIDMYNQTDGGKKKLESADLAGLVSTIQSYDALEKQASDKVVAAGASRKASIDLENSIIEGRAKKFALTKAASDAILHQAKQAQAEADALTEDPTIPREVVQQRYAMASALMDQGLKIVTDSFANEGIDIAAYNPQPPARPPVTPGAIPMGMDVSSLKTVPVPVPSFGAAPAGLDFSAFDARLRAGSAPAAAAPAAPAQAPAPTSADFDQYGYPKQKPSAVAQTAPAPAAQPSATVAKAPAAPAAHPATTQPVSPQNLLTGKMPKKEPAPHATEGAKTAPVTTAPVVGLQSQTANEIIGRQTAARQNYLNSNEAIQNTLRNTPGLPASSRDGHRKTMEANQSKIIAIDKLITDQTAILSTQMTAKAVSTSEQRQLVSSFEKGVPQLGGGWMHKTRANAMEAFNSGELERLEDVALTPKYGPQFQGSADDVRDTISSLDGFMKAAIATDKAIDRRLASGDKYLDRIPFTSKDFTTLATGNIAEKLLLANMRKIIVSGGNFSDQDRKFILEAIASINTLDPTKGAKYFKDLNRVMGKMGYSMYADKLDVAGFVNRPDLTGDDNSPAAKVRQEFETRFGTGEARAKLEALIKENYGKAKASEVSALGAAIEEFATPPPTAPDKK